MFAQIIYMSNLVDCDESQIPAILQSARNNNPAKGITGMLLYGNCGFVQVLEGQLHAVRASFNTIRADNRHQGVVKLDELQVAQRQFSQWSMGYVKLDTLDLNDPNVATLFHARSDDLHTQVTPGIARAVLKSFSDRAG